MYFTHLLASYVEHNLLLSYAFITLAIILEGELVLIILGVFVHAEIIPFGSALMLAGAGAFFKTIAGYNIGNFLREKVPKNKLFDFIERRVLAVFPHFVERPFWSLFFSKFVYGLNHFTIIMAGYVRVDKKTYFSTEAFSSIVWITLLFATGYFFSYTAFSLTKDIRKIALIILVGIIVFLLVSRVVNFIIEYIESE